MVTLQHRRKHHAWTPRSDSGLWIWHAADQQGGTDGVAVSQLTDLSGNGRHITTGASKPLYRASGVKGKPSFDFVGSRSISQSIAAFTGSELAWFMAVRVSTSAVGSGRIVSLRGPALDWNSLAGANPAYTFISGGLVTLYANRNNQYPIYASGLANNSERVLTSVFTSTRLDTWIDGAASGGAATGSGTFNFNTIEYGRSGPELYNGMLAEVFALTGTVDSTRRLLAENYLRAKYPR